MLEKKVFKKGDFVTWTSQAGSYEKTKTGQIVAVVAPGIPPKRCVPSGFDLRNPGGPRNHESYLVQVGRQINLYWPLVKKLEKAKK